MRLLPALFLVWTAAWPVYSQPYTISPFAGGGLPVNLPGTSANLLAVGPVAVDASGNLFFVGASDAVLRQDAKTGILTLVAGTGIPGFNGDNILATAAQLNNPGAVAVDTAGNLYIADYRNHRVRKVSNGVITTVAGNGAWGPSGDNGPAVSAQLAYPVGVALDSVGNLYILELNDVRKVSGGVITTVAGGGLSCNTEGSTPGDNGPATGATLCYPDGIAVDSSGDLYIADTEDHRIRKVSSGVITTVAGNGTPGYSGDDGPAASAQLFDPESVSLDAAGNLYIADNWNNCIRKVSRGVITTIAGTSYGGYNGDGQARNAQLSHPSGATVDSAGNLYISDAGNGRIRKVTNGLIATVAGGGPFLNSGAALDAALNFPYGVAVDPRGDVYISDSGNNIIRRVSGGVIATVAGNGTTIDTGDNGPATSAGLADPLGVAVDSAGDFFVAEGFNRRVRKISGGIITTVAGNGSNADLGDNGPATSAGLNYPMGVAVDSTGNLYIADLYDNRIRKVSGGVITTVAGTGTAGYSGDNGPATSAQLSNPWGVAVDSAGNLYIADLGNTAVRKVSSGIITTVAGGQRGSLGCVNGPAIGATLVAPAGVAVDSAGNLYIADSLCIAKVSRGAMTTIAGNLAAFLENRAKPDNGDNGPATLAQFNDPVSLAVDTTGNIYLADTQSNRIRLLTPGTPPTITQAGIVSSGGSVSAIQPGSWISIFGSDLASGTFLWNGDFPISLGGTRVTVDNQSAYLWFVSPQQINLQVPDDTTTGRVEVVVTTPSGSATATVTLAGYAPSFSLLGDGRHVAGEIATPNGDGAYGGGTYDLVGSSDTFSFTTRPVKVGETLILFGVGFGPTTPIVTAGQPFSGVSHTNSPVTVAIGGVPATVSFAGITEAGLYQLNVTLPATTASGDQAVKATVNGVQTPLGPVVTVK